MSKEGAVKVLNPLPIKALGDKFPVVEVFSDVRGTGQRAVTEVRQVSLRTTKTFVHWWRALPSDGVRAVIAAGVALVIGVIPALVAIYRRRNAP
jgi:hypothetical protein